MIKEYKTIHEIASPLMIVEQVEGVTYDELCEIQLPDGSLRRGKVLEVNGDKAIVQLYESAAGINLTKLESRPVEGSDFEFRFIFELEASVNDERTVRLLTGLANDPDIEHFTFLGAYEE